jgi:hypothetical protein
MRTIDIELAIMKTYDFKRNLIVPGITAMMGLMDFEVDMFLLTKSNMGWGFEIKTTMGDLMKDLNKPHFGKIEYYRKFKFFYYVVPQGLESKAEKVIPDFCGLSVIKDGIIWPVVPSRLLGNYKWTDQERYNIARLGAMRIYNLKRKIAAHG